jgi:hypothetical protein
MIGAYTIQITATLPNGQSNSVSFTLNVNANCRYSIDSPIILVVTPTEDQVYTRGTAGSVTFAPFIIPEPLGDYCRDSDIYYTLESTPANSFISLESSSSR